MPAPQKSRACPTTHRDDKVKTLARPEKRNNDMTAKSTSLITVSVALAAALTLGSEEALAAAECTDAPGAGNRIECTEDATSTSDIEINASDLTINTSADGGDGIRIRHLGTGKIDVKTSGLTISTTEGGSTGIQVHHSGSGNIVIESQMDSITTAADSDSGSSDGISVLHEGINEGDIVIRTVGTTIQTVRTGTQGSSGIYAQSSTEGKVEVDMSGGSIDTFSDRNLGIFVQQSYNGLGQAGDTTLKIHNNASITTEGDRASAISVIRKTDGKNKIDLRDVTISTIGKNSFGVLALQDNGIDNDLSGDVEVNLLGGVSITTAGEDSYAVWAIHQGVNPEVESHVVITARGQNNTITTSGAGANGIIGRHSGKGDIIIDVNGAQDNNTITTKGISAAGIVGHHSGEGGIKINVQNATIVTESIDRSADDFADTYSQGIFAIHQGLGDIDINVRGGSIETRGTDSYGVFGLFQKADHGGKLLIRTSDGNTITTKGPNGHGIEAQNYGTLPTSTIFVDIEGSVTTTGQNSQGVRVGALAIGSDGYRQQTVTVNGPVKSNAEGVYLAGGGRVVIGPRGSIDSESGIAILATGDTAGANPGDPVIKPKLRVDMNLGGRKVEQAIGNNWIINDGGETTIAVNSTVLHEGATGFTGLTASNGAWNVTMREHGVKVTNRTAADPANWVSTESTNTAKIIADRDFNAQDFTETEAVCPLGQIGTPPDCMDPPPPPGPTGPMFMEEYAPRAALYEVLPDFMLRMQNWEPTRPRLFLPESPVYIRLLESTGSQEFKRSTVNANYDADRFAVEAGVNISLSEDFKISASAHHVTGSADVSSPVNGGDIDVTGAGLSVDAYWSSENDYYATGRLSLTDYDIDLSSNTIGRLKSNGDAYGQSVHIEAGRRMTLSENLHWTPRAWLGQTSISVDKFTDAVDSQVSFPNTDRFTGGLGVMAESVRTEYGGELLLRGSLDFEQKFGDSKTVTLVSGERLSAEPEKSSVLLSLGGAWHKGPFKFSAELSARQDLNSGGEDYSGIINVGMHF